jgi:hypothetical protein
MKAMSYSGRTTAADGQQVAYHVQARGQCRTCKTPVGVGTCERCTRFAAAVEELAQAVYRRFDAETVARLNAREQEGQP